MRKDRVAEVGSERAWSAPESVGLFVSLILGPLLSGET